MGFRSSFARNRERLLKHNVSRAFFEAVLRQADRMRLLSSEHCTVDGTLLESWASFKSLQPRPNLGGQRKPKKGPRDCRGGGGGGNPEARWPARATAGRPGSAWPATF